MEKYYDYTEKQLLNILKEHNQVDNLILEGVLYRVSDSNYGFFKEVEHSESGRKILYPILDEYVESIYISLETSSNKLNKELIDGQRYIFSVMLSPIYESRKKKNPFLLQAKVEEIIIEISSLQYLLDDKKQHFQKLEIDLVKITNELASKEKEANETIDEYNQAIISLHSKILDREDESEQLSLEVKQRLENITHLDTEIKEMKETKSILFKRIKLCQKLDFISDDQTQLYLNQLEGETYYPSQNTLDFQADFSGDFNKLSNHILQYLYHEKDLLYTEFQIKNFITLLRTNDLIVLSGLSGSGKTQIVKSIAEAIDGVVKIIPVKPNWMSSDDLIGYYNPLQSTFLPTPFAEAIVEARQNPDRVYLICLDEMNLARVEYYFADLLSKLEERNKQPVIELYASHEEERFISEFQTMLDLLESSIGTQPINSWKDFLNNDTSRKRFFELLGNLEKENMLQIHAQMKRRLIDILKFPSSIEIPDNVRFIGAINIDETTHYFSPKILDRVHIVRFDNPLLLEKEITNHIGSSKPNRSLKPVYVHPKYLEKRKAYPALNTNQDLGISEVLKEINRFYLLPLSIDFGVRSIRQAINYGLLIIRKEATSNDSNDMSFAIALNAIVIQKILPRFVFSSSEKEIALLNQFSEYLKKTLEILQNETDSYRVGYLAYDYLDIMIDVANDSGQVNYWVINYWAREVKTLDEDNNLEIASSFRVGSADEDLPWNRN